MDIRVQHSGTSAKHVARIIKTGFGKGTYFCSTSSLAAQCSERAGRGKLKQHTMLVCRVIVGDYCIGTRYMDSTNVPFEKHGKQGQYETCVDSLQSPSIFVINKDYHAVATHIITYERTMDGSCE